MGRLKACSNPVVFQVVTPTLKVWCRFSPKEKSNKAGGSDKSIPGDVLFWVSVPAGWFGQI